MKGKLRIACTFSLLLAAGCSLVLNTSEPVQCRSNDDCESKAALSGRVCEQGFCVIPRAKQPTAVAADSSDGCVDTKSCTKSNSNRASRCEKTGTACVPWQIADCPIIEGPWDDPDVIMIGVLEPLSVLQGDGSVLKSPYIQRYMRAVNLGVTELVASSPQGLLVGNKRRPVAVLHCDSYDDPTHARAMFDHLVDVVGAQSIITVTDEDVAAIAEKATAKRTAVLCSDCQVPPPEGPLVWNSQPTIGPEGELAAWRVSDLEAKIRADRSLPASTPIKVATITEGTASAKTFTLSFATNVKFNDGKSVVANGASYLSVETPHPRRQVINHLSFAQQVLAFEPDVVVVAMGQDFPTYYMPVLEGDWPAGKPRPHYVLTNLSHETTSFESAIGSDDALRKRFSGTHPVTSSALDANIEAYTIRYRQQYNNQAPDSNWSGYEAFYSLTYAITAATTQSLIDGPHISTGFESLVAGTKIDVGPQGIPQALSLLTSKSTVDLRGMWTDLDWDTKTRAVSADRAMFCFTRGADGHLVIKEDAGPKYSAATKSISGTYACD